MTKPDPKLETSIRRVLTTRYKLSVIEQTDACKYGELDQILRREKAVFRSTGPMASRDGRERSGKLEQICSWARIQQLEKENARLLHQIEVKDGYLSLQESLGSAGNLLKERIRSLLL